MDSIRVCRAGAVWEYGFFLAAGISVLAKGPVSLVLCGLIILVFVAVKKRWICWRLAFHPGVILCCHSILFMVRKCLVDRRKVLRFKQFIKENFERFFVHGEGGTGHQKPIYYFIFIYLR